MKTIQEITKTTADEFGLTVADLRSTSRMAHIVLARHTAIYLACLAQVPKKDIGTWFHRDPRSIYYSVYCVKDRQSVDKAYRKTLEGLLGHS